MRCALGVVISSTVHERGSGAVRGATCSGPCLFIAVFWHEHEALASRFPPMSVVGYQWVGRSRARCAGLFGQLWRTLAPMVARSRGALQSQTTERRGATGSSMTASKVSWRNRWQSRLLSLAMAQHGRTIRRTQTVASHHAARLRNQVRKQFQTKDRSVGHESSMPPQLLAAFAQYKKSAGVCTSARSGCLTMLTLPRAISSAFFDRDFGALSSSIDQLRCAIGVAMFCVRLNLEALYFDDIACMGHSFDDLLLIFSRCSSHGIFMDIYFCIVSTWVLPSTDENIMKHIGSFSEVE